MILSLRKYNKAVEGTNLSQYFRNVGSTPSQAYSPFFCAQLERKKGEEDDTTTRTTRQKI